MEESKFTDNALAIITNAQNIAKQQSNTQIAPIHLLGAFCNPDENDNTSGYLKTIIERARYDWQPLNRAINQHLVRLPSQSPTPSEIGISYATKEVIEKAEKYMKSQKDSYIAQDHLLLALLDDSSVKLLLKETQINGENLRTQVLELRGNRRIDSRNADTSQKYEFLSKYAIDVTEQARQGKLDPVIGREEEIRRTIRVLARRTKSNPCLIGDPGVGKTSIVEGVAQRIVDGDVPTILQGCKLFALDITSLRAGAKFKGEFEERVQGVLKEIEEATDMTILFIDEIHMLMGDGTSDAANLLKPMLARGTLHCIGATTITEYRKYVEKDGAFERRFQKIDVREPTVRETTAILRGLAPKYEIHHGVRILDSALVTAAQLAKRYLTYRKLPDSAVDLIDESAATVAVARDSKPEELDSKERELQLVEVEIRALERDVKTDKSSKDRLEQARQRKASLEDELRPLRERFNQERAGHEELTAAKRKLDDLETKAIDAERRKDTGMSADLRYFAIPDIEQKIKELEQKVAEEESGSTDMLIQYVVGSEQVAETAARLTGIPVSKLSQAENDKLISMESLLSAQVVGQGPAVKAVSNGIRLARSGLANPHQPASFLFLGLSGSGKTELAKKLAGFLFNDEKAMIRIDCSELSDKWSSSKLLGSAPGYVGYEEGGILTNALSRQPYSVILFDEIEKAAPEVLTVLLQLLDDGRITSSAGKTVDGSNSIIIMTSNLGAELIAASPASVPTAAVKTQILDIVKAHFRPEFLNRISETVVFNKLSKGAISKIVHIRLKEIERRFASNNKNIELKLSQDAIDWLCEYGYSPDLGARPLNRLIQSEILNKLAILILKKQVLDNEKVAVEVDQHGDGLDVIPNHEAAESIQDDSKDWDEDVELD